MLKDGLVGRCYGDTRWTPNCLTLQVQDGQMHRIFWPH